MKKKRYQVRVQAQTKTKDFAYIITDTRTKDEITMGGYSSFSAAWRGFDRAAKNLYQKENIEKIEL